jgi:hypothetical protein
MCASSSASGWPGSSGGPGAGGCTPPADAGQATASCSGGHPQAAADTTADRPATALRNMAAVRAPGCGRVRPGMPAQVRLWPAVAAVPDRVWLCPHEVAGLGWLPQGPPVSTLLAGVRSVAGHPSGPRTPAWPSTPAWPCLLDTSCPEGGRPEAADGQSADRSGSLHLPLLFLKAGPAGGSSVSPKRYQPHPTNH